MNVLSRPLVGSVAACLMVLSMAPMPAAAKVRAAESAPTQRVHFHLEWASHAGERAPGIHTPRCDDTTAADTLYLSFQAQSPESTFLGIDGELYVYAAPGDTLGEFWHMEKGGSNRGGAGIEFAPAESFPDSLPWAFPGVGIAAFDRTASSGRLRFVYAVPADRPSSLVAGRKYAFARIIFARVKPELPGCESPVCIEWRRAKFRFGLQDTADLQFGEGRWVARGTNADICRARVDSWRPRTDKSGAEVMISAPTPRRP